ncbi:MAG: hypothetical protein WA948_12680 [Pontixanthobacter sp.]
MPNKPDLTHVDPHNRKKVVDRIAAIKRFNKNPGRKMAEREAARLGISFVLFYKLVKSWNIHADASRLPGANRRQRKTQMKEVFRNEIARLDRSQPGILPERVTERINLVANNYNLNAPSAPAIHRELNKIRRASGSVLEQNSNILIDHCHLMVPVQPLGTTGDRQDLRFDPAARLSASAVTMTAALSTSGSGIVGLALSLGEPEPGVVASAIINAIENGLFPIGALRTQGALIIDRPDTKDWKNLIDLFRDSGITVEGELLRPNAFTHEHGALHKRGNGRSILAHMGRFIGGYRMAVRKSRTLARPSVMPKAGSIPFTLKEAEMLIRARVIEAQGSPKLDQDTEVLRNKLLAETRKTTVGI